MNFSVVPKGIELEGNKVSRLFQECTNPNKISLGIGVYRDDYGRPLVLKAVAKAKVSEVHDSIH